MTEDSGRQHPLSLVCVGIATAILALLTLVVGLSYYGTYIKRKRLAAERKIAERRAAFKASRQEMRTMTFDDMCSSEGSCSTAAWSTDKLEDGSLVQSTSSEASVERWMRAGPADGSGREGCKRAGNRSRSTGARPDRLRAVAAGGDSDLPPPPPLRRTRSHADLGCCGTEGGAEGVEGAFGGPRLAWQHQGARSTAEVASQSKGACSNAEVAWQRQAMRSAAKVAVACQPSSRPPAAGPPGGSQLRRTRTKPVMSVCNDDNTTPEMVRRKSDASETSIV